MCAIALNTHFIPPPLLIRSTWPLCRHGEQRLQDVTVLTRSRADQRYRYKTNLLPVRGDWSDGDLDCRRLGPVHKDAVLMLRACDNLPHSCTD